MSASARDVRRYNLFQSVGFNLLKLSRYFLHPEALPIEDLQDLEADMKRLQEVLDEIGREQS